MLRILVVKEKAEGETRVAATPESVKALKKSGLEVLVQAGAGDESFISDEAFEAAGASIAKDGADLGTVDLVIAVNPPTPDLLGALKEGAVVIGFLAPYKHDDVIRLMAEKKLTSLPMELVPRITRAQKMDALSSQANIAGYKAVLVAAGHLPKYFPLLMTAAGTVKPARVVVMGAGVAGLQAIATAKRLGAVVEASDIRPAVKEQVESLGAKFIDLPKMEESGEGKGGYAKEVSKEFLEKQQAIIKEHVVMANVVITTALMPGKPAPKLVTADMVQGMKPGAVIIDLAVEQGGNCELSELGRDVRKHGVLIVGDPNLPRTVPGDASMLYARNVAALVQHLVNKEGALVVDEKDEITGGTLLTHAGKIVHAPTAERLSK